MAKRLHFTRRLNVALSEDAYRTLRRFSDHAGISQDEALCFLFEHFGSVTDQDALPHRLRLFKADLAERKRQP
ncbi:hypothetical protein [Tropicimonas isoalkanivorans]|uniref:Uncharacterized protein n=1 Tax=Tropicimonas isoalkanivorans TaxID=441112 RepID=A0A1I1QNV6_9RHOB|nr:hypothetical protein [Tropicimonas isoalkanivorans]SFD23682.1 hypothetical protein SAMN04488094_12214 [Tropicimonas isoalkanivorans]